MSESERVRKGTEAGKPSESDPSMDDILASIRRILAEEETVPAGPAPTLQTDPVLQLDSSMIVQEPSVVAPPPPLPPGPPSPVPERAQLPVQAARAPAEAPSLVAPEAATAAANSVGSLVRTLAAERSTQVSSGGPTIEDIVRSELRPLLKQWLDTNLPSLVERLVRAEIERVLGRAVP
jgi:uncharacterized protein